VSLLIVSRGISFTDASAESTSAGIRTLNSTGQFEERWSRLHLGQTYYVRPDGGSLEQCTGLADAAYPGSGVSQPCAWDHPFRALPPHQTLNIDGGDTLIVADGSYMMGYGAPETDGICSQEGAFDCFMPAVPSGPNPLQPTRILGAGWDAGCSQPPELWGTQRAELILNLTDSSNVEIACFEITDHSGCVEFHSGGLACERYRYPFGEWAAEGLYAEDSSNVRLADLNIHGLASNGVHAGRLINWTVENVHIAGNGWAGWDGDVYGEDSNSGSMNFKQWLVEWNGCGESYPDGQPNGCWSQSAGVMEMEWAPALPVETGSSKIRHSCTTHPTGWTCSTIPWRQRHFKPGARGRQRRKPGQDHRTSEHYQQPAGGQLRFLRREVFYLQRRRLPGFREYPGAGIHRGEQDSITNTTFYGQGDGLVGLAHGRVTHVMVASR